MTDTTTSRSVDSRARSGFIERTFAAIRCWQVASWAECGIVHGFLGSDLDFREPSSVLEFERTVLNELAPLTPPLRLALLDQVHGVELKRCDLEFCTSWTPGLQPRASRAQADGWLARGQGGNSPAMSNSIHCGRIALGILTADCMPVLIRCTRSQAVAALHCGWRSALGGLLSITLQELLNDGSTPETLEIAIGPGASVESYQVGLDLAMEFRHAEAKLAAAGRLSGQVVRERVTDPGTDRDAEAGGMNYFLDISALLNLQAQAVGLNAGNIFSFEGCTIKESCFFSFRREKDSSGRQLSFITQHLVNK